MMTPHEQSPPSQLLIAIRQFNNREWYECHETLEEMWGGSRGELRAFLQGTLRVAVALHHWRNGNLCGSLKLLDSGVDCLCRVPGVFLSVDVASFVREIMRMKTALEDRGNERSTLVVHACIPVIRVI
jgi:predicted metal-dependent hydrolase